MMIPSYLRFGFTINSWVWFIAIVLIIKDKTLLSDTLEKHRQFLTDNDIVLLAVMIAIILSVLLDIILLHMYYTYDSDSDKPITLKIPLFWTWKFWGFNNRNIKK